MAKRPLTNAEIDSHKVTLGLHMATAARLISEGDYAAAKTALELALPHANAIHNPEIKSKVFGALNTVRAQANRAEYPTA